MQGTKNLTEGPIKKQLFNLALPIMGTSFIQMAYSITDMAWVGRLGSEAVGYRGSRYLDVDDNFDCLPKQSRRGGQRRTKYWSSRGR